MEKYDIIKVSINIFLHRQLRQKGDKMTPKKFIDFQRFTQIKPSKEEAERFIIDTKKFYDKSKNYEWRVKEATVNPTTGGYLAVIAFEVWTK